MDPTKAGGGNEPASMRFILDTAAILEAANLVAAECSTPSLVAAEIRPGGASHRRLEHLLAAGMRVEDPSTANLELARRTAKDAGSLPRLTEADLSVVALALDRPGTTLLSDDYTVLDLAMRLGLEARPVTKKGIESTKAWKARCSGCGRTYPAQESGSECRVCGAKIRLRVRQA